MKKLFLSVFAIVALSAISFGQNATALASAKVVGALGITKTVDLSFGSFIASATTNGTVNLNATSAARSAGGSVAPILVNGGGEKVAIFELTGTANDKVSVSFSTTPFVITGNTGAAVGKTMNITSFTWNGTNGTTIIPVGNLLDINVGAILAVSTLTNNPAGIYEGTFTVTASYE